MLTALTTARWHLMHSTAALPWSREVTASLLDLVSDRLGYLPPGEPAEAIVPIAPLPPAGSAHCIALCLGHARPVDQGSVGAGGVSEEEFNGPLLAKVQARLARRHIRAIIVDEYPGPTYGAAMRWLAGHLRELEVTAAVEFHFNASEGHTARGHEVIHWEGSKRGITLAQCLHDAFCTRFPQQRSRGIKPRGARSRGALFLALTHCPAAIAEPFFGDNPDDWALFDDIAGNDALADAYAEGIAAWVRSNP